MVQWSRLHTSNAGGAGLITGPGTEIPHAPSSWLINECVLLSHVRLFVTPWTVALKAPLSMGFSWQEYWSGLLFYLQGNLLDPGFEPESPASPTLAGGFFTTEPPINE